jgi:carboxyl-terminal processing protease
LVVTVAFPLVALLLTDAQELNDRDRARGRTMLKVVKKDIRNRYYDPQFHGLDLDARFLKAEQDIGQATSLGQMLGIIAQAVLDLNDSHSLFVPPARTAKFHYEWRMRAIGDRPYVVAVRPGSDAAAKGLKAGDAVLLVDGFPLDRGNIPVFRYRYFLIRPAPAVRLVVQSPGGMPRQLDVVTRIEMGKRVIDLTQGEDIWDILRRAENLADVVRYVEWPDEGIIVLNVPSFMSDEEQIGRCADRLRKFKSAILDLRGNAGGYMDSVAHLLGFFFDHDVTIGQPRGRQEGVKPIVAKTQGKKAFAGKLVVLVDSDTGSGGEVFARVVQLEKRGTVIGDRTSGSVMVARYYQREMGGENIVLFGISVSEAELIMADGQSLEKMGVRPDIFVLPTAEDLAAERDPVLARALAVFGALISPVEAGKIFPYTWVD